jgi:GT2 family glycosyltransferase
MRVIAALITCHNRKANTMACLRRLFEQALPPETALDVYLVDDGSTDGTADDVRAAFPTVNIIPADGTLYWSDGMRLAWRQASKADPDAYFWLNDDTVLYSGALASLLAIAERFPAKPCIAVGSCRDAAAGRHTYGGEIVRTRHPAQTIPLVPDEAETKPCDTFNGNCVLVTRAAFRLLGPLRSFKHAIADTDYGLRATRMGIPIQVAPGYLATCDRNPVEGSWRDRALPRRQRMRILLGRKGLPPGDWWRFLWAHAGLRALLYWPAPYVRVLSGL